MKINKKKLAGIMLMVIVATTSLTGLSFADTDEFDMIGLTTVEPNETDDIIVDENISVTIVEGDPSEFVAEEKELNAQLEIGGGSAVLPGTFPESTKRPSNVWNIATKGKYSFKGTTPELSINTLYTEYKFKGKNNYTIYVKNTGKDKVKVKAKRKSKTYASTTVSGGKSATITFSGIKKTTEFYITFNGTQVPVTGYIK